jgi:hypothetical protein
MPYKRTKAELKTLRELWKQKDNAAFLEWANDLYDDDEENLQSLLADQTDKLELLNDYIGEKCQVDVREDGLITFSDLYDSDCDVRNLIGTLPVVVYHHTASGAIPGIIERGGIVSRLDLGIEATKYDSGAGVYVTTEVSGPVVSGYAWRAVQRFGGTPVTLAIKTHIDELEADPDDADISCGRHQFVLPYVDVNNIVEGLR